MEASLALAASDHGNFSATSLGNLAGMTDEYTRLALASGLTALILMGVAVTVAIRLRNAKWKRLRMRGDARAKVRELEKRG